MSKFTAYANRFSYLQKVMLFVVICFSQFACEGQMKLQSKGAKSAKAGARAGAGAGDQAQTQSSQLPGSIARVVGKLGQPIGTILVIEGSVIDNRRRAAELGGDDMLLKIEAINFKKLATPIIMPPFLGVLSNTLPFENGKTFALVGYETGAYAGVPVQARRWAPNISPRMATGIEFKSYFQILSESDGLPLDWGS